MEVRKFISLTNTKGYSESEINTKVIDKETGLEYQLQIILPTTEAYWKKYKKSDKLSVAQLRK
jgi:hypothetical protein